MHADKTILFKRFEKDNRAQVPLVFFYIIIVPCALVFAAVGDKLLLTKSAL